MIAVKEDGDVGRVEEVEAVVVPDEAAGGVDVADELGDLVGAAVLIGIAQAEDTTAIGLAAEGAVAIGGNVEVASGRGGDVDGVVGGLPGSEEGLLEAFGDGGVLENSGFFGGGERGNEGLDVAFFFEAFTEGLFFLSGFIESGEELERAFFVGEFDFPEAGP